MRIYKYLTAAAATAVTAALTVTPQQSHAQESSLGTYSPYTMYGIGNLNRSFQSAFAGMGGASIGFRNHGFDDQGDIRLNLSNPASLSALVPASFIFDVGMVGTNQYLSQQSSAQLLRTSFNSFNVSNISMAMPLAAKHRLGMALSVSPFSEVGYKIQTDDEAYLADLGYVRYRYNGQGDVTEARLALGWAPFKRISIGAELDYLWGNIDRNYTAEIKNYTGSGTYNSLEAYTNEKVGKMFATFGLQYTAIDRKRTRLTFGASYRTGGPLGSVVTDYIPSKNIFEDVVRQNEYTSSLRMARRIGVGAYLHRPKWLLGADYVWEDWAKGNAYDAANDVSFVNSSTIRLGGQYTPNRYDLRGRLASFFNRMTYKAGVRSAGNYMQFRGEPINERAVTVGVDVPFKVDRVSKLSLGLEYGSRGTLNNGLVRERFFRVNLGIMFFGGDYDYWFQKVKYY
jgi:hypothetical protein